MKIHPCDLPVASPQIFKGTAGKITSSLHQLKLPAEENIEMVKCKLSIKFREQRNTANTCCASQFVGCNTSALTVTNEFT